MAFRAARNFLHLELIAVQRPRDNTVNEARHRVADGRVVRPPPAVRAVPRFVLKVLLVLADRHIRIELLVDRLCRRVEREFDFVSARE